MINWDVIFIIFCLTITLLSGFIAYEFYKSRDGRLRILIIRLFVAKVFVYGGAAALLILHGINYASWMRVALNTPMFFVMLSLYAFIRMKDK